MQPASVAAIALIGAATAYGVLRRALLSLTYAVAILAVYALQVVSSPSGDVLASSVAWDLGIVVGPGLAPAPASWITFEFVHGSVSHVFLNLVGLILISPRFEERIGSARWVLLFFAGGAFGAFVFVLVHFGPALNLLVGSSAGVLAALGAYGRLYPKDRVTLFLPLPGPPTLPVRQVVLLFLVLDLVLGVLLPSGVAWEAHAGALLFGFATAPAVMRLPLPGRPTRLRSLNGWRHLATTPELGHILEEAERADLPETRNPWIEKFVTMARCPRCGGPLRFRFGRFRSDCGWQMDG